MTISHLKNRILVQVLPQRTAGQERGIEFQLADILKYFGELKRGPNTEIGTKDFFEKASKKHAAYILCIFFTMMVMGCAGGISRQSRSMVTYKGSFSSLQKTPDAHKGEIVMFGGRIIETKTASFLSELTVLQLALDSSGRPVDPDQSQGRFIVQTKEVLDPEIYQKDRMITVVGRLKGSKDLSIGGFDYTYPLVEPIEIKLWPKGMQTRPVIHFGIGFGTSF
jgi:outer membrane lipoprotein